LHKKRSIIEKVKNFSLAFPQRLFYNAVANLLMWTVRNHPVRIIQDIYMIQIKTRDETCNLLYRCETLEVDI